MANTVILGVYESKSALDEAELENASDGDTYIVGTKIPYDLYTYSSDSTSFEKGDKVSNDASDLSGVTIDDVNTDTPVEKLFTFPFKGEDGKTVMVRKGLHLGEIHFYRPLED